mgnify:CR=1 FL=1
MIEELQKVIAIISQYENLSLPILMMSMAVSLSCGLAIYLLYRYFYRGVVYSDNFGVLIVLVSGVTTFIILTIGANLVLSLGMVGALSIVRFRAPVKEPLDVGFLYWAIAVGVATGARLYLVAIVGTVAVGFIYIIMTILRKEKRTFLLILRYASSAEEQIGGVLNGIPHKLKNKSLSQDTVELTVEVRVLRNQTAFMAPFTPDLVSSAVLVEYNGDYA